MKTFLLLFSRDYILKSASLFSSKVSFHIIIVFLAVDVIVPLDIIVISGGGVVHAHVVGQTVFREAVLEAVGAHQLVVVWILVSTAGILPVVLLLVLHTPVWGLAQVLVALGCYNSKFDLMRMD